MSLNESQQQELRKILDSDLFKRAQDIVLHMTDGSIDELPLDQAALKMSNEKGVRNAFRLLSIITNPKNPTRDPLRRKAIKHNQA